MLTHDLDMTSRDADGVRDALATLLYNTERAVRERVAAAFEFNDLAALAKMIDEMRADILFDDTVAAGLDPFAEQELLASLALLDAAVRHMQLAHLHQVRTLAGRPR
jgi:hypothetical protein